jgi:hypothetical protein
MSRSVAKQMLRLAEFHRRGGCSMQRFLIRWALNSVALWVVSRIYPGVSFRPDAGLEGILLAGLVLGLANALIRPLLLFFTFPLNLLTLGLFTFVVNAYHPLSGRRPHPSGGERLPPGPHRRHPALHRQLRPEPPGSGEEIAQQFGFTASRQISAASSR